MDDRVQYDNTWTLILTIMILCFLMFVESCYKYASQTKMLDHVQATTANVADLRSRISDLRDEQYELRKRLDKLEAAK